MEGRCERHLFDQAVDLCGRCGSEFCNDCIVYAFGPNKPPYCLGCAVEAAGVRKGAGYRPPISRRQKKQFAKDRDALLRRRAALAERGELVVPKSFMDGDDYALGD